jgi:hypothetical protein
MTSTTQILWSSGLLYNNLRIKLQFCLFFCTCVKCGLHSEEGNNIIVSEKRAQKITPCHKEEVRGGR